MSRALTIALAVLAGPALVQDRPSVATVNYSLACFAERLDGADAAV